MKLFFKKFAEPLIFAFLFALAIILAFTTIGTKAVKQGIGLWATCVIPSLFPYFFITAVLSTLKVTHKIGNLLAPFTKKVFNVGGLVGYAFLMSIISGYPIGAKIIADLKSKNLIEDVEAERASVLCSTSSPAFMISAVGRVMFNSVTFGICLFIGHIVCSFIIGFLFSFYKRKVKANHKPTLLPTTNVDNVFYESVYSAVISVLTVGGIIIIFYVFTDFLYAFKLLNPVISIFRIIFGDVTIANGFVLGLFECTKGLKILSNATHNPLMLPICATLCGFGGLSVIMQSCSFLKKAKIKTAPFLLSKAVAVFINFFVFLLIGFIF